MQHRAGAVDEAAEADATDLEPGASRRLAELFDRQARGVLFDAERAEIEALVAEYGQRLHERRLREYARQRGLSVEQARREAAEQLDAARARWHAFEADPGRRAAVARSRGRQARGAG